MKSHWSGPVIAYIDMLLALTVVLLALTILVQPTTKAQADTDSLPAMTARIEWAGDYDVDLWGQAPDGGSVGYSNKTGHGLALLRDDLGPSADADSIDTEIMQATVLRPGEYAFNAHLYRVRGKLPVHVTLWVRVKDGDRYVQIAKAEAELVAQGDEVTLVRFRLDDKGRLVPGSVNRLPMALRNAK